MGVVVVTSAGALAREQGASESSRRVELRVVVSLPPLKGLVEPLLPEGAEVTMLMRPGRSEHGYEFTPADLRAVADADVVVLNGLGLEARVERAIEREEREGRQVVIFSRVVGEEGEEGEVGEEAHPRPLPQGGVEEEHVHGPACEHEHGPVDQHLWLDPVLVGRLVPAVRDAIANALRADGVWTAEIGADLDARASELVERVRAVDRAWREGLEPHQGKSVVTHHNAFPRAAERYGFRIATVIRGMTGQEPTPSQFTGVIKRIKDEGVKAVFFEPQFNPATAQRIAKAAGVEALELDPLGDGDWEGLMRKNLESLVRGLSR
jgi:ABC-type Zn uptake system ZnuABC Zn-binding protein ZnuA